MRVWVNGKTWDLSFVGRIGSSRGSTTLGLCEHVGGKHRRIRVLRRLQGQERLRILLHELLHAALWDLSEETVDTVSKDLAEILYQKLGYRSPEDPSDPV